MAFVLAFVVYNNVYLAQCGPYQVYESFGNNSIPTQGGTWTATSLTYGTTNFRSGLSNISFNASGDIIRSPLISNPGIFSFWYRRSGTSATHVFIVETSTDNSVWSQVGSYSGTMSTSYVQFNIDLGALSLNNIYVRVRDNRTSGSTLWYIDDMSWTSTVSTDNTVLIQGSSCSPSIICGVNYKVYDIGGINDQYNNSMVSAPMVITPASAGGVVSASFSSLATEASWDKVFLYNGNSTSATQFSGSSFSGTTTPSGTFTSTHSSGAITLDFTSDNSTVDNGFFLNVSCTVPTPCTAPPTPGNTLASVTSLSAGATTNLSLQNATSGSGVTYQWYSSTTSASGPWTAIGSATSATYTATPAATSTWYYCEVTCSGATGSSTPVLVTANYCTPTGSTSYYLTNVTTTNGITNFNNTTTNSAGGYGNYSATISTSNYPGYTTNISMTPSSSTNYYYCWIDWNNDLDFLDAGEAVITSTSTYLSSYSGTITVPSGQAPGTYRMRVANSWLGTIPSACGPAGNGEFEDYSFIVVAQTPCSGTPVPGNTLTSAGVVLSGGTTVLSLQNATVGSGVTYQWYASTASATGPWTLINGATNSTYTATITANSWFYCIVTCPGSGSTSSTPVGVTVTLSANVDCSSALQLCSDSQVNGASSGAGIQDLTISNSGCLGYLSESESNWFYSQVSSTGVFSFTISPVNGTDDYDFAVWRFAGTPATCPPSSQPDRCSFAAVGGNTGLGNNATDLEEGTSGDKWVSTLNVNAGDYLLILVNNYSATTSPFTMDFTGSSSLNCNPVNLQCNITGTTNVCAGSSTQLTGSGSPATTNPWTSSSPTVATVSNTGLVSGLSAGTTTITYVNNNNCSTSVLFTVNATPNVTNITSTVCSGNPFTITPTNVTNGTVPEGTTYTWSAPTQTGVAGGTAGSGTSLNATLTGNGTAVYTFSPTSGSCPGANFTVTINVEPCSAFQSCNLVVYRVGDGSTLNTSAQPVSIEEKSPVNGNTVQFISSLFANSNLLTQRGTSTLNGMINSYNGFTAISGHNVALGTASVATSNTKAVNIIGSTPSVQSRILFPSTGTIPYNNDNLRGVIPTSSNTFYTSGDGTSLTGGLWYYNGNSFDLISTSPTSNVRCLEIFNNQLFYSTGAGTAGIYQVGSTLPTTATSATPLITYAGASPVGFFISPDGCTAYIADDETGTSYTGISKWRKIAGTWTWQYRHLCFARGLVVDFSQANPKLYVTTSTANSTSSTSVIALTDNGTSFTLDWTQAAGTGYIYVGIDFTPNSTSATISNVNNVSAQGFSVCQNGTPQTLTVAAATSSNSLTYQWFSSSTNDLCGATVTPITGATSSTYTPPTSIVGTTYYFAKISSNCATVTYSSVAEVIVNPNPSPTITGNAPLCAGQSITLTGSGGTTYVWTLNGNNVGNSSTLNVNSAGNYNLNVTDANGCTGSASVVVNAAANAVIHLITSP